MKHILLFGMILMAQVFGGSPAAGDAKISPELLKSTAAEVNVLLIYEDNDDESARRERDVTVRSFGGSNFRHYQSLGIGVVRGNRALLDELKKDRKIRFIAPDRPIKATAGSATYDQVEVRTVVGVSSSTTQTGTSVGVAVIDSGVSNLAGFGTSGACSTSRIVYSQNFASDPALRTGT